MGLLGAAAGVLAVAVVTPNVNAAGFAAPGALAATMAGEAAAGEGDDTPKVNAPGALAAATTVRERQSRRWGGDPEGETPRSVSVCLVVWLSSFYFKLVILLCFFLWV